MKASADRTLVLVASLSLTALLGGALASGWLVSRMMSGRLNDPEYLQAQIDRLAPPDAKDADSALALVRVSSAERKTIQPQKPLVGRLVEVRKVTVASEVTGKIIDLPVDEGTPVVGGETLLAKVDEVWTRFALAQSRASVASTKANLAFERSELDRIQRLVDQKASSRSELEAKLARVDELEAELEETQAGVEEQSERLIRSEIRAPFDGTVVAKHAELGGHVSPGTPLVEIVSRGQIDALIMVPESIVNLIHLDQELSVRVDPLKAEVAGRIVSITPYGPAASRTFPVRVRLDDQQGRLKVGMSVTATVHTGPAQDALVVSRDAVLIRPDGSTVWVAVDDGSQPATTVQPVPVNITLHTAMEYGVEPEDTKTRELLVPGAQVVIEGAERLTPGLPVRVVTFDQTVAVASAVENDSPPVK